MAHNNPKFLKEFGLQNDASTGLAFDQLNSIIGAQGSTRSGRAAAGVRRRGGAGSRDIELALAAQEAGTAEQRRLTDFGLVEDLLIRPSLESRNVQLNRLRSKIAKEGGDQQARGRLFRGLGQVAGNVAQAFAATQAPASASVAVQTAPSANQSEPATGQQLDRYGNPV